MTSSLKRRSLSKPKKGEKIHQYDLETARARNKNSAHSFILELFAESNLTKSELAKMLDRKPEQITRWFAGPGNMTFDTFSDLVFALSGDFVTVQCSGKQKPVVAPVEKAKQPQIEANIDEKRWRKVSVAYHTVSFFELPGNTLTSTRQVVALSSEKGNSYGRFGSTKQFESAAS